MSAHPAEVRDAVQLYIEQAYRPVLRFHVHKAVTDRLDTYTGQVGSQMLSLERDGKIAKHVSPSGTEYWYSPKSETFCGTCGALALPGRQRVPHRSLARAGPSRRQTHGHDRG